MTNRSQVTPSLILVHGSQVGLIDCGTDSPAQACAGDLISSKMYPAVNARVGNIVGNLLKRGVLQDDVGQRRVCQWDRMSGFAVKTSQDLGRTSACAAVV